MFFEREDFFAADVRAARLSWQAGQFRVAGRGYDALAYRVAGEGVFRFSDADPLHTAAGEVLFLPAGVGYDVTYTDGQILVFHFHSNAPARPERFTPADKDAVCALFERACLVYEEEAPGYRVKTCALFYEVLDALCRPAADPPPMSEGFRLALSVLRERFCDPDLSVERVCREAFVSPSSFRRTFRAVFGKSPIEDLTERRLRRAEHLLLTTGDSVEQIAAACGFSDAKYFCRVMHRKRGYPPSALRGRGK